MKDEIEIAYAEVDAILNLLTKEAVEKIPLKFREFLKKEKDKNYIPKFNENSLKTNNIKLNKKTICILTILEINYWCESEEEKKHIINELKENDKIKEKELRERYNPDNIFKDRNKNLEIIEYKEKTFIRKILDKILRLIKNKN